MEHRLILKRIKWLDLLWIFVLMSIFFPIRYVFVTREAYIIGGYSDFTSFSLYLSDIFIFVIFLASLWQNRKRVMTLNRQYLVILTLIFLVLMSFLNHTSGLTAYKVLKIAELLVLFVLVKEYFTNSSINKVNLAVTFVVLSAFQSILGIYQFITGKSLGLYILGESHLSTNIYGAAKIVSQGTRYLRGYGTFPHPNLLAAALFTGILFTVFLLFKANSVKFKAILLTSLLILSSGLVITFSRAGLLAFATGGASFIALYVYKSKLFKKAFVALVFVCISLALGGWFVRDQLATRATDQDRSIDFRYVYNKAGWEMIKDYPLSGIGVGNSLLHMEQYSPRRLEQWEIQPVHNYFILTAAEAGLPFTLLLIIFWGYLVYKLVRSIWNTANSEVWLFQLTLLSLYIGFLCLMLFDHYFYTLQQTQLLLWLSLGLIAAEIEHKRELK